MFLLWNPIPQYYTQTPRFAQAQNSVNTREICTTSNNGIYIYIYTGIYIYIYTLLLGCWTEDVASTYHMALTIQWLRFLKGFQVDIKIPRPYGTINHTVIRVSYRDSRSYHYHRHYQYHHHHHYHHHRHLGLPGRSLRVRANLRVLPYACVSPTKSWLLGGCLRWEAEGRYNDQPNTKCKCW